MADVAMKYLSRILWIAMADNGGDEVVVEQRESQIRAVGEDSRLGTSKSWHGHVNSLAHWLTASSLRHLNKPFDFAVNWCWRALSGYDSRKAAEPRADSCLLM